MIELRNISKSYDELTVLNDINITFEDAQMCMLLGPSGCGKSTLLKLINRLLEPDSGSILIDGAPINRLNIEELRRNIGYAIQGVGLFPHMNVGNNIAVVPKLLKWSDKKIKARIEELIDLVGLPGDYITKHPSQLSGGEAQRVGVARALAADPKILLMDEPFGALDPITRQRLQQEFMTIQRQLKKTVVFVTHDVGEAVRMADNLVIINDGSIQISGHPEDIPKKAEAVTRAFLGDSYTLELLNKHNIADFPDFFSASALVTTPASNGLLLASSTFKEALSLMLQEGSSTVTLQHNDHYYNLHFDQLIKLFGGVSS